MNFRCPVCAYDALHFPPRDYHICPCCGTEFGNDDEGHTHAELRSEWIGSGANWFFGAPPLGWNPYMQLIQGGFGFVLPNFWGSVAHVAPSPKSETKSEVHLREYFFAHAS